MKKYIYITRKKNKYEMKLTKIVKSKNKKCEPVKTKRNRIKGIKQKEKNKIK